MFGRKPTQVNPEPESKVQEPEPVMSVAEIIATEERPVVEYRDLIHLKRLLELNPNNLAAKLEVWKTSMKNEGFTWLVERPFIQRFGHAAVVTGEVGVYRSNWYNKVLYAGDIPDFALDRIDSAKKHSPFITIHSNEALSIREVILTDPIVIAWNDNPLIIFRDDRQEIGSWANSDGYRESLIRGFVIAAWDLDKELF